MSSLPVAPADDARQCLFCQARPGSREHLFPNWLNSTFPVDPTQPKPELARHAASAEGVHAAIWTALEMASAVTKLVCHDCNTGWMSRLESRAKPLLEPMMLGHPQTLNPSEQLTVATWACKTVVVFEATLSTEDNFSIEDRQVIMSEDRPPASTEVIVAAVIGEIAPMHYAGAKIGLDVGDEGRMKLHFHTVQAGTLVLQIIRRDPPPTNYGSLGRTALPRELELPFDTTSTVFPTSDRSSWPPSRTLDWDGVLKLERRGVEMPEEWGIPEPTPPKP